MTGPRLQAQYYQQWPECRAPQQLNHLAVTALPVGRTCGSVGTSVNQSDLPDSGYINT